MCGCWVSWVLYCKCFLDYLENTKQVVDFAAITKDDLNRILHEFYGSIRNNQGQYYSISSYVGLRAGINCFIINDVLLVRHGVSCKTVSSLCQIMSLVDA